MTRSTFLLAAVLIILATAETPHTQSALPRLEVDGHFFRQETGARWTGIEATDFNLFSRFVAGEDITPILRQRADVGFNLLRVWTDFDVCADGKCREHQPIGRLVPSEHPDYYARLPEFLDACAQHGLYVELTAFTGRPDSDAGRIAHWEHLIAAVASSTNVLLELINEHNVHEKSLPYDRLRQPPAPILASHGSGGAGATQNFPSGPTRPITLGSAWTGCARRFPKERPQLTGTTCRCSSMKPRVFQTTTPASSMPTTSAAAVRCWRRAVPSIRCQEKTVVSGRRHELALAREWARGARSVPLACQRGAFRQVDDSHVPARL